MKALQGVSILTTLGLQSASRCPFRISPSYVNECAASTWGLHICNNRQTFEVCIGFEGDITGLDTSPNANNGGPAAAAVSQQVAKKKGRSAQEDIDHEGRIRRFVSQPWRTDRRSAGGPFLSRAMGGWW